MIKGENQYCIYKVVKAFRKKKYPHEWNENINTYLMNIEILL